MKKQGTYYVPTLSTVNGYLERLAANPNAYAPDVKKQIDWRIGITGQSLRRRIRRGSRSPSAPTPACRSTAATPTSSS